MSSRPLFWLWNDVLTLKEIKKINKFIMSNHEGIEPDSMKARTKDMIIKKNTSTYIIAYNKIEKLISHLVSKCYAINNHHFGYKLWPYDTYNCHYNVYKSLEKGHYDWHTDCNEDSYSDIKLTLLINLSEKSFEGGDFYLQETNETLVQDFKNLGSMILFRSPVRHMVTPVVQGERKNLVLFLTGPNFI